MASVRIWTLESDYDAKAVRSLAEKLAIHLQLDQLSIQVSGKGALPKPKKRGPPQHEMLRRAVQNYLMQDDCVIFVIDSRQKLSSPPALSRLIRNKQPGDTENIVEAVAGGEGPKEYLIDFSKQILLGLNPNMQQRNIKRERYHESMAPEVAEHVEMTRQTLGRNASLRQLGNYLARVN